MQNSQKKKKKIIMILILKSGKKVISIKVYNFQHACLVKEFDGGKNSYSILIEILIHVSRNRYLEVVKLFLIVPQMDANVKDKYCRTALILASENGHHEIINFLLTVLTR